MREKTWAARVRFPLAVLAGGFFVPTYESCHGGMQSPAQFSDSPFMAASIVPVFFAAAALAWLTWRALRRGEPDVRTRRLGLVAVGLVTMGATTTGAQMAVHDGFEWPWLASAVVGGAVAVVSLRFARGQLPWRIWLHVLLAFVAVAVAAMPTIYLGGAFLHGAFDALGPGAYLYFSALSMVAAFTVLGLRAGRRI